MTSPLKRIESHPHEAKRLIGIEYQQFLSLVALAEERHLQKQAEIERNKVRINAKGGGRKAEMSSQEGVCLCLVYLRQKPIFEILGLLFDVSKTKANDAFNYWVDILREILPASQMEEVEGDNQKYKELRQLLTQEQLIVDSAEQPTARPVDYEEQKKYSSGKKKMHTMKNQFIVLPQGQDIVDVAIGNLGKTSDINLFRSSQNKFNEAQKFLGDKAYKGEAAITTPHKKPKNGEITELQKKENKEISSSRIGGEHVIGMVKIFRVATERFSLARTQYKKIILTICGLVRLRINRLVLLPLKVI
jgi:hypothetical protein